MPFRSSRHDAKNQMSVRGPWPAITIRTLNSIAIHRAIEPRPNLLDDVDAAGKVVLTADDALQELLAEFGRGSLQELVEFAEGLGTIGSDRSNRLRSVIDRTAAELLVEFDALHAIAEQETRERDARFVADR